MVLRIQFLSDRFLSLPQTHKYMLMRNKTRDKNSRFCGTHRRLLMVYRRVTGRSRVVDNETEKTLSAGEVIH